MDFLQRTPFFRLLIPVVAGVILYRFIKLPVWVTGISIALSILVVLFSFLLRSPVLQYKLRWLFGFGVFLFFVSLAYSLCTFQEERNSFDYLDEEGCFLVEVVKTPVKKSRSYLCEVELMQYSDLNIIAQAKGRAYVYFQPDAVVPNLSYGDRLFIRTTFSEPEEIRNPDGFDYPLYLKRKGVGATAYVTAGNWKKTGESQSVPVMTLAQKCRDYLLDVYRKFGFEGDEFAVLSALTLGYTDELDADLRTGYSASGVMHILAVSGLHIGIVYVVFSFLLGFLNKGKWQRLIKTVLILLLLWSYAFITGLPPSVFRATLMFSFVAVGAALGRKSSIYNTIFMSAFLMLLLNPNLLFNVGFQLSYSAVLSIVYFQPKVSGLLNIRNRPLGWLWNLMAVSVAAQIGTLPITLYYFQVFPNYFLLSNLIAIPAASIILYLAVLLFAVSWIPYLSASVAYLLKLVLSGLNISVDFIYHLPFSVSNVSLNGLQVFLVFLAIFSFAYYFRSKKYHAIITALSCLLFVFSINLYVRCNTLYSKKVIVYAAHRNTHVNFIDGNNNYVYTTDYNEVCKIASSYWNNNKIKMPQRIEQQAFWLDGYVAFGGLRFLILRNDFSRNYLPEKPIEVDYLVVGNGIRPRAEQLLECVIPLNVIVDKTVTDSYTKQWKKVCEERNINFHSTRYDGAYIAILE
ncbi:ComEC family competence protein [Paludibacter sp. 221]|uniref:ComEC/Rec2 family competence protein n=1 Tax=Paludibacter sp. 221 TaxID=2302939 RepID=UPI0013D7208B|nr:ComEC/Rec2 family competence protein [Paludibacter sp. 221]NDV47596.1 ComEC family competence protein [Paludibacter sp. 221]